MKRLTLFLVVAFIVALALPVFAGNAVDGNLSGSHFQFNIIGKKNNDISGDTSNGRSIMIPLHTTGTPNYVECGKAQSKYGVNLVDDVWPNWSSDVPDNNARLVFEKCAECVNWEISDRDAIDDGEAIIKVPVRVLGDAPDREILFDVYIRVMGKPLQCMEINGYAYDGSYYFKTGTVYLSKNGRTAFVKINDLFDVYYCSTRPASCGTEISVFADVFQSYFWELYNDGTKVVQVRIYPQPPQPM